MRGVDRGDQLINYYYNVGRRSRKWWKRIFFYLIEVSFLSAYILEQHSEERRSHNYLAFRLALGEEYIGNFRGRKRIGWQCSLKNENLEWLNPSLGHLAEFD